jgi:RimJ/RimL family protein N-acetyltransferase
MKNSIASIQTQCFPMSLPGDATAFFIDTIGFIPSYRGRGLYTAFLNQLLIYLEAVDYERVTTTHHPNNRAILMAELKAGFNP